MELYEVLTLIILAITATLTLLKVILEIIKLILNNKK